MNVCRQLTRTVKRHDAHRSWQGRVGAHTLTDLGRTNRSANRNRTNMEGKDVKTVRPPAVVAARKTTACHGRTVNHRYLCRKTAGTSNRQRTMERQISRRSMLVLKTVRSTTIGIVRSNWPSCGMHLWKTLAKFFGIVVPRPPTRSANSQTC